MAEENSFWVARTLTGSGPYAAYCSALSAGEIEIWLQGGFERAQDALEVAREAAVQALGPEHPPVRLRKRTLPAPDKHLSEFGAPELSKSLEDALKRDAASPSWKAVRDGLFSGSFILRVIFLVCFVSFVFDVSITVPKGLGIPFLGETIGGKTLGRSELASSLPAILVLALTTNVGVVVARNIAFDTKRRLLLQLALFHGWRREDFRKALAKQTFLGEGGWFARLVTRLFSGLLGKLLGFRAWRRPASTGQEDRIEQWSDELQRLVDAEFERRIHNLYWLERQRHYSPYMMCFDPLLYLLSLNRTRWALHDAAVRRGVDPLDLGLPDNPDGVDLRGPWISIASTTFLVAFLAWAALLLPNPTAGALIQHGMLSLLYVVVVVGWFHLAVICRWGFPVAERLGAYTVDVLPNRLSVPGG